MSTNTYFQHYVIHYKAKTLNYMIYDINMKYDKNVCDKKSIWSMI